MKKVIDAKLIHAGFALILLILGVGIGLSAWSLIEVDFTTCYSTTMLMVLITNSLSLVLLGWVYQLTRRGIDQFQKSQESLYQSEERFQIALKNSPTIVFNQDTELRYTWAYNPTPHMDAESVMAKCDADLLSEEDAQRLTVIKRRVLSSGIGTREKTFITINGEIRYYDLTVEPLRNQNGDIIGITCVATDITQCKQTEAELLKANEELESRITERTAHLVQVNEELVAEIVERRQVEIALRKSEFRYRHLVETIPHGIVELDATGTITFCNRTYQKMLGYTEDELLGKSMAELILESERSTFVEYLTKQVQDQPPPTPYFGKVLTGAGNLIDIQVDWNYQQDDQSQVTGFISVVTNITQRKQTEQALIEERNFVSAILDIAGALIVVCDREARFISINPACEKLTGYSLNELQGISPWDMLLIPEEIEAVKSIFHELQVTQSPNGNENYWVTRDGNRRLIAWSNTVLLHADGSIKYIVSIGLDITDRKRAEEMRRALERERELSDLRLRFFSMASHEFRTPLSTILMSAQVLESSAYNWSVEKCLRNVRRISTAAKHMTQLLTDILTINRAETGRLEFQPQPIDLEQFCQQLLDEIRSTTGSEHTLNFSCQGECHRACFDERLLRSILTNLLSNAVKYSPQGGQIDLALVSESERVTLQVRDHGIGIPVDEHSHLFEAFHRGSNSSNIPGTGLGLTVVKKCVDLHGGTVEITSKVGMGTTFTITLPTGDG
ncbi:MAG TPA: PAS domain S-box protein [Coleofasciculaceae cyanobacterium]